MHIKRIKGEITQKVIKRELSFLYATHCHDLFYITSKYHQNIPNGIQVIRWRRKCLQTDMDDGRTPGSSLYPRTFRSGDKKERTEQNSVSTKPTDNQNFESSSFFMVCLYR